MTKNYLFPTKLFSLLQNLQALSNYSTLVKDTKEMIVPMPEDNNDRISLNSNAIMTLSKKETQFDNIRVRLSVPKNLTLENVSKTPLLEVYLSQNNEFKRVIYTLEELSSELALAVEAEILSIIAKSHGIKLISS